MDSHHYQIENVLIPAVGNHDINDLRQNASALFPPEYYVDYLVRADVRKAIGAETEYGECPDAPYIPFSRTGDVSSPVEFFTMTEA